MSKPPRWFDRLFEFDYPVSIYPNIVERLRGTIVRVEERVAGLSAAECREQGDGAWSIQEHVGHLFDLEPLWFGRIDDLLTGEPIRPADLENRKTHEAGHNDVVLGDLLRAFRDARAALVARFDAFDEATFAITGTHPRLKKPMRMIDLAFFVAEHDDHHLAAITDLRRRRSS